MHRGIGNDDKDTRVYGQAGHILPESEDVESKGAQDRSTRHFNIQPVLSIDQSQKPNFIDAQSFKPVVEDG